MGKYVGIGLALVLAVVIGGNVHSLEEGVRYLRQMRAWDPAAIQPLAHDGPYGICYDLVCSTNAARYERILRRLREIALTPILIPVADEPTPDILVLLGPEGPRTVVVAHYDKFPDTETCWGASDNTAAVSVLLAVAHDLASDPPRRPTALLLTSAEERGLRGAYSFVGWAQAHGLTVAETLVLDMIGRGRLAARPSALPGFYFWLPGLGTLVYDGQQVARGARVSPPDAGLVMRLREVAGSDLSVYRRFAVNSDSNVFQSAGWPTVAISSDDMYYLHLVWGHDMDRVELLDERNLALAHHLVVNYLR